MSRSGRFVYLSAADLEGLGITTAESVASIEQVVHGLSTAQAWAAPKSVFIAPDGRYFMATLAASDALSLVAVKSLVMNSANTVQGLPAINATVTVLDADTGLPVAVVDGNWVTAIRTAGLSAVAARRMARADASVLALIGCGVQAHSHLTAFTELFPVTEVRVFGRGSANRDKVCERADDMGLKTVASSSGQQAIEGADLIVTTVTLDAELEPFLDAAGMKPGAFAAVTDFAKPWKPDSMPHLDRIIVDDLEQESTTQTPMVDPRLIKGDLRALVTGQVPARESDTERNAFLFRGLAIGDLALAGVAVRKALAGKVGTPIV